MHSIDRRCIRRGRSPLFAPFSLISAIFLLPLLTKFTLALLEHFRAKWIPVRVKKTRQNENLAYPDDHLSQRRTGLHGGEGSPKILERKYLADDWLELLFR